MFDMEADDELRRIEKVFERDTSPTKPPKNYQTEHKTDGGIKDSDLEVYPFLLGLFFVILLPIGIIGYQSYLWLKDGIWPGYSLFSLLPHVRGSLPESFLEWVSYPETWIGVHKLVTIALNAPLWITSIVLGFVSAFLLNCFVEALK